MPSFISFFAPLALLLPGAATDNEARIVETQMTPESNVEQEAASKGWLMLESLSGVPKQFQVRIERRLTIRISPQRSRDPRQFMSTLPQGEKLRQMAERKIGNCVKTNQIVGVQPMEDDRLLLFLRDQKMIAANLEKACSARDFYSGLYVEDNADGQICIDRDKLRSRTGANCAIKRMRQLVPADT
ncbi:hypothetical protein [Pontixanthobacter sp.]|uniref:hypothetical protein n=1 Tax=Pontixanthobacter sp. TaxID=2792078 RepID=UPI003C7B4D31